MRRNDRRTRAAGFWIRFAALWIDGAIAWLCAYGLILAARHFHAYLPLELVFVSLLLGSSALLVARYGRTVGKMLCGLRVRASRDEHVGYRQGFIRETIAKCISTAVLFLGFLWVLCSRKRRAWHDLLTQTTVVQSPHCLRRGRWVLGLTLGANILLLGPTGYETVVLYVQARQVAAYVAHEPRHTDRGPTTLTDVASLSDTEWGTLAEWLTTHGEDPREYVVEVARQHAVTIIGERHGIAEQLEFLNAIIGDLYHRAEVTCLAMEACIASDNPRLLHLVTAPEFDRSLALDIARNQGWARWGWKGYWDVFESVWQLNSSLPAGAKRMRIVGIDTDWDGPSFALLGLGDDGVAAPFWEKLRVVRLAGDVVKLAKRDELMALNVEKQILRKGERGVVWVGSAHSPLGYRKPSVVGETLVGEWPRMGVMLHEKYGSNVFQILLHDDLFRSISPESVSRTWPEATSSWCPSKIGDAANGSRATSRPRCLSGTSPTMKPFVAGPSRAPERRIAASANARASTLDVRNAG
jgi:uncharacterized RDD family membrane protein YckC